MICRRNEIEACAIGHKVVITLSVSVWSSCISCAMTDHHWPLELLCRTENVECKSFFDERFAKPAVTRKQYIIALYIQRIIILAHSVTANSIIRSEEHTSELQSPDQLVCRF